MTAHVLVNNQFVLSGVLAKQRAAFLQDGPPDLKQRKADLAHLKSAVLARRAAIEAAVSSDFGNRSAYETRIMELIPLIQTINYLRRNLRKWMRPERRRNSLHFIPASSYVMYQPLGVVGIISPWNYPFSLALMPLATAIAAGNRVMLKPSEHTPATSALMKDMLGKLFPEDQVSVTCGGPETGSVFASLPFDHLVFTGSTAVGTSVLKNAAENLVPVTLELGGKSPAILGHDADFERAAVSIAYGKLANAGQTCIAPDFVLVPRDKATTFAEHYKTAVQALYPEGAASRNYTSIINARHQTRLRDLLADARKKGATIVPLGPETPAGNDTGKASPVLMLNVTMDMAVMKDEIFGPILPLVTYDSIDEAIKLVNRHDRPLALYYFGNDGEDRRKVLARTTSGNVTINDTLMHYVQNDLPFGGVGASGMGAYHGPEGFRNMSHAKGVFEQSRWNLGGFLRPPFRRVTDIAIRYLLW
ncbi:coniferyl aldehyde dehydrogenase [Hyphomicrobium methylovorum]|uniref:coniferyl aldehyde dehydrogenase n=1 Tax=Hyphomicrobium methylovorum TaxID=84 RepID=UPI0015E7CAFC|nr:coniferyl aldehyde dehydrogenase [Hyphomicrobium methylovorum]MBA2127666.1 coniferyl aldehyde dehydrogenase [Hyphomicrobium methylovorum]